jgi:hypothetical protein
LLKDAGCSSNASRLFHILSADEIRAKCDVKTTDWTRLGWESLQYAVSHVATAVSHARRDTAAGCGKPSGELEGPGLSLAIGPRYGPASIRPIPLKTL